MPALSFSEFWKVKAILERPQEVNQTIRPLFTKEEFKVFEEMQMKNKNKPQPEKYLNEQIIKAFKWREPRLKIGDMLLKKIGELPKE